MSTLLRKLRGILGMGLVGGALGGAFSLAFLGALAVLAPGDMALELGVAITAAMAWFGAFLGCAFAGVLTLTSHYESVESITGARSAAMGAAAGAIFMLVFAALTGFSIPLFDASILLGTFAGIGAGLGAAFIAVAKSAHREELAQAQSQQLVDSNRRDP